MRFINLHSHHHSNSKDVLTILNCHERFESISQHNYFSAGIHPWHLNSATIDELEKVMQHSKVLTVGECGMDKLCNSPWELQEEIFCEQIKLANKYNKPLILHCVRAFEEVIHLLIKENNSSPVIFHGFNKGDLLAKRLLSEGYYLSFGKNIMDGRLDQTLRNTPIQSIFLETDDSDLTIKDIYQKAAEIKGITLELLCKTIEENFLHVFKGFNFTSHE